MATDIPFTYCHRKRLKTGWKEYWRYRRAEIDCPLPGKPGDPAFHTKYAELQAAEQKRLTVPEKDHRTVDWLIDRYLASAEYQLLAGPTQVDYQRTCERIRQGIGPDRYDEITRADVKEMRDEFAKQPRTAHKIKQMVSALYAWADQEELLAVEGFNPAANLKRLKWKSEPIMIWSDEEIDLFLMHCEPFIKTVVMLALYTGQRREDLVRMDWTAVQGEYIRVRQNKTGEPLTIRLHPRLKAHLDTLGKFGGKIIRNTIGKPMNAGTLSSALNRAVASVVGMPHRTIHGLRYAAAGQLEAAGCSVVEISSIIGHRTYQMAMKYMRQRKDSEAAIRKATA